MAGSLVAVPTYPDVPKTPGVPAVRRPPGGGLNTVNLLIADGLQALQLFATPQWGLFQNGQPALVAQTIKEVEFRASQRISDAPQAPGAFLGYNKVPDPAEGRLTFLQGGGGLSSMLARVEGGTLSSLLGLGIGEAARAAFLAAVKVALASLALYDLVMPEATYSNMNVIHYDFRRTAQQGLTLLAVDVWVQEVRVTGTTQFTQTATPAGQATTNGGQVQAAPPTASQAAAAGIPANAFPVGV
jgi:hypothetical protein